MTQLSRKPARTARDSRSTRPLSLPLSPSQRLQRLSRMKGPTEPRVPRARRGWAGEVSSGRRDVIFITVKTSPASQVTPLDRCAIECVEPERVRAVLERLPSEAVFQDLAETFRVLSDPGRVRLISALLE